MHRSAIDAGNQDLAGFGLGAKPGGELDGRSEQIVVLLDRLAGADADADGHRACRGAGRIMLAKRRLDLAGAADRAAAERKRP